MDCQEWQGECLKCFVPSSPTALFQSFTSPWRGQWYASELWLQTLTHAFTMPPIQGFSFSKKLTQRSLLPRLPPLEAGLNHYRPELWFHLISAFKQSQHTSKNPIVNYRPSPIHSFAHLCNAYYILCSKMKKTVPALQRLKI